MNNMKLIRLTETDLHRIVRESVNNIVNEAYGTMSYYDELRLKHLEKEMSPQFNDDTHDFDNIVRASIHIKRTLGE